MCTESLTDAAPWFRPAMRISLSAAWPFCSVSSNAMSRGSQGLPVLPSSKERTAACSGDKFREICPSRVITWHAGGISAESPENCNFEREFCVSPCSKGWEGAALPGSLPEASPEPMSPALAGGASKSASRKCKSPFQLSRGAFPSSSNSIRGRLASSGGRKRAARPEGPSSVMSCSPSTPVEVSFSARVRASCPSGSCLSGRLLRASAACTASFVGERLADAPRSSVMASPAMAGDSSNPFTNRWLILNSGFRSASQAGKS